MIMRKNRIRVWIIYAIVLIFFTCLVRYKEVVKFIINEIFFSSVCSFWMNVCISSFIFFSILGIGQSFLENYKKIKIHLNKMIGEKQIILVYCIRSQQEFLKDKLEKFGLEVKFVENKKGADIILTDEVSEEEKYQYQRIAYTPLVIGVCAELDRTSELIHYLSGEKDTCYMEQLIEDVVQDHFKYSIYCPKGDSIEEKIFYNFLLLTVNKGKYPQNKEQMESAKEKVNSFLEKPNVYRVDMAKWLQEKRKLNFDEVCICYERDLMDMVEAEKCKMSYPKRTVLYELYYKNNNKELDFIKEKPLGEEWSYEQKLLYMQDYRINDEAIEELQKEFSYVEVPLED